MFASGRIKLNRHESHKDRLEVYAVNTKRSREACKRRYDRSVEAPTEHYQSTDSLLIQHSTNVIYRVFLKGDINAAAYNAHVFVLMQPRSSHVMIELPV